MQVTSIGPPLLEAKGGVQRAEDAARKRKVHVNSELLAFDVPADCRICLGEERVGLQRLQPLDHVRIAYAQVSGVNVTHSIQASWFPFSLAAS
jgi:hypothetical protein